MIIAAKRFESFRYGGGASAYTNRTRFDTNRGAWEVVFYEKEYRHPWNVCCLFVDPKTGGVIEVWHGE